MLTMQEYIEEVMGRLARYEINAELDDATLESIINRSRRDVQLAMLSLYRERYSRVISLGEVNGNILQLDSDYTATVTRFGLMTTVAWYYARLPDDFLREIAVHYGTEEEYYRMRKTTLKEMYSASTIGVAMPTPREPQYAVVRRLSDPYYTIYVSIGDDEPSLDNIEVWYLRIIDYLERHSSTGQSDIDWETPPDAVELVIYQSMMHVIKRINLVSKDIVTIIEQEMEESIQFIESVHRTELEREYLLLPSRESVVPNIPIHDVEQQQQSQ